VVPTFRGVGLTLSSSKIQFDRYSAKGDDATVSFIDTSKVFGGWKTILPVTKNGWIRYNSVDFGKVKPKTITVKAWSAKGGTLEVRDGSVTRQVLASVKIPQGNAWRTVTVPVNAVKPGIHHLVVAAKSSPVEVDWISFK